MELSATIPALLSQQAAAYGSETIFRRKDRGIWNAISWADLETQVRQIGQGLRASGLAAGGVVALISQTRPELAYADLAVLGCGGVSVAIHPDEDGPRVGEILREMNAAFAVVDGEEQLDKVLGVRLDCPALRQIIIIDMKGLRDFHDPHCISLSDLLAGGIDQSEMSAVASNQPAAILVSRDGPAQPMTHGEIMRQIDAAAQELGVREGDERLAVLPMSDPTERVLGLYLALKYRIVSNYLENPETASENLREVKPTMFGADTEAWERLHDRTTAEADAATSVQKMLYRWAIGAGAGGGLMRALANVLVLPSVRGQLGFGKLRVAYVGDGAISPEIDQWARGLGIKVRYINPFQ
jgi:long-chain acyl-CoA synthetase